MGAEFFQRHARGPALKAAEKLTLQHLQAIFAHLDRTGDCNPA